jgi:hypothetical protein
MRAAPGISTRAFLTGLNSREHPKFRPELRRGGMAEWSMAVVLKTVHEKNRPQRIKVLEERLELFVDAPLRLVGNYQIKESEPRSPPSTASAPDTSPGRSTNSDIEQQVTLAEHSMMLHGLMSR